VETIASCAFESGLSGFFEVIILTRLSSCPARGHCEARRAEAISSAHAGGWLGPGPLHPHAATTTSSVPGTDQLTPNQHAAKNPECQGYFPDWTLLSSSRGLTIGLSPKLVSLRR